MKLKTHLRSRYAMGNFERTLKNLSQSELADKVGISFAQIGFMRQEALRLRLQNRIADALGGVPRFPDLWKCR